MSGGSHLRRAGLLILGGLALFLVLRLWLKPRSFGDWGHYRREAISVEGGRTPLHQNRRVCLECHDDIGALHGKDVHAGIECHVCHGDGAAHVALQSGRDATIPVERARMPRTYTLEGCLFCHRRLAARPANFPQIDVDVHFRAVGVRDRGVQCVACHSPHEPLYMDRPVATARLHPIVSECLGCHETRPAGDHRRVPGHPVIFTCADCHAELQRDFAGRSHAGIACTTCHQSHPENENSERIFKNSSSAFCRLCHEAKPFKDPAHPPKIDVAVHAAAHGVAPAELVCVRCHMDNIHRLGLAVGTRGGDNVR